MMIISWASWSALFFQVLIGKAMPTKTSKNTIRGRQGNSDYIKESDSRIKQGIRTTRTADRLGRTIGRDLLEEPEANSPDSDDERFPYLASLMDESLNHICGGTLIARDMLLTAASCGDKRILSYIQFQHGTIEEDATLEILATFPNPKYNQRTGEHNTMLVQLTNPVERFLSSTTTSSDIMVQVLLNDADAGRPSRWPVSILKEGQTLTGFNFLQHKRISNDENDNGGGYENEWEEWKMGYLGKDSCQTEIEGSTQFLELFAAKDGFCLERLDLQFLASSPGGSESCQPGEVGGPIIWTSNTTGARLIVGVNTWGIGCWSSVLPYIASLASAGGDFIRRTMCSESASPPSYMGCTPIIVVIEEKETTARADVISTEFSALFGATLPANTAKAATLEEEMADPVAVYLLLLFDSKTDEHISWTIRESSTNALVASAPNGTYASHTDFTELVELVPGKTYEIEVADGSLVSVQDRVRGIFTDFAIVVSEPPQEIATGKIGFGTTESFMFTVPNAGHEVIAENSWPEWGPSASPSPQELVPSASSSPQEWSPSVPSSSPQERIRSASSSSPQEWGPSVPSSAPQEWGPSASPSPQELDPSASPSQERDPSVSPSSQEWDLSASPSPQESGPSASPTSPPQESSCVLKGELCNSSADCCSRRCGPQKQCFSDGAWSRSRSRMSLFNGYGGYGGSAASRRSRQFDFGQ